MKRFKKILGVMLLIAAIAFFIVWEFFGRAAVLNQEVCVLNQNVMRGNIITKNCLTVKKVEADNVVSNAIKFPEEIIGKEAKHFVPANAQLVKEYFGDAELVLNADEEIFKIPAEWMVSFPDTLRRKDQISIYAMKFDEETKTFKKTKEKVALFETIAAYVKDSANREVTSLDTERLVGSYSIASIEIIINAEQLETLEKYIDNGYSLAILYK